MKRWLAAVLAMVLAMGLAVGAGAEANDGLPWGMAWNVLKDDWVARFNSVPEQVSGDSLTLDGVVLLDESEYRRMYIDYPADHITAVLMCEDTTDKVVSFSIIVDLKSIPDYDTSIQVGRDVASLFIKGAYASDEAATLTSIDSIVDGLDMVGVATTDGASDSMDHGENRYVASNQGDQLVYGIRRKDVYPTKAEFLSYRESTTSAPTGMARAQPQKIAEKGDRGQSITNIQEKLIELGLLSGEADGIFGNLTEDAVKTYQRVMGLEVDGVVWESTYDALIRGVEVKSESGLDGTANDKGAPPADAGIVDSALGSAQIPQGDEGVLEFELDGIVARAVPTKDNLYCVFIANNAGKIIDDLTATIYFMSDDGQIIDLESDGHDMILPGYTVVSRISMSKGYSSARLELEYEIGVNPRYKNHSADVSIATNKGSDNIIVQVTNNGNVEIREIEYVLVFYLDDELVSVGYPNDVYDVAPGKTVIEKEILIPENYDRHEVYLNQAHTFD